MLDQLAVRKGVELTLFTDPEIPAQVLSDGKRLRQIVINLGNNAIKFSSGMARPGRFSVRAVMTGAGADRRLEIHVTDNGIGMKEDICKNVFDKFYRSPHTLNGLIKGVGLGLFYVKQAVDAHGWQIGIQSTIGEGSNFTITIPY